jgi:uncharacterized membrane protein (DUF2068 family)
MNTGTQDALQAAGRYIVVIVTAVIAIFGLLKAHNIAGLFAYVQTHGGELLASISGLISLGVAVYGIFKTHKRGVQATPVIAAQASNKK